MALRFLLVGMVSLGSCQSLFQTPVPPPREDLVPYHGAPARSGPPRRVVMLPFDSEAGHADYATALASQIQQAIAGRALFEVIPVADEDLEGIAIASSRRRGIYRTEDLIAISRRFCAARSATPSKEAR